MQPLADRRKYGGRSSAEDRGNPLLPAPLSLLRFVALPAFLPALSARHGLPPASAVGMALRHRSLRAFNRAGAPCGRRASL